VKLVPDATEYQLYYAQALYQSQDFVAAAKACIVIDNPDYIQQVLALQAIIKYETNDIAGCRLIIEHGKQEDPDVIANTACLLFKVNTVAYLCVS